MAIENVTISQFIRAYPLLGSNHGPEANRPFILTHLSGENLKLLSAIPENSYLTRISTDGIIPANNSVVPSPEAMGPFALTGLKNIPEGYLKKQGINAIIVGDNFGGGSSRVHAPIALKGAGIDYIFVVGKDKNTFGKPERIFRENTVAMGGPFIINLPGDPEQVAQTLTDINENGIEKYLLKNYSQIELQIMQSGGVTEFHKKRKSGELSPELFEIKNERRHQTTVEKILSLRAKNIASNYGRFVKPGDVVFTDTDKLFAYELQIEAMIEELEEHFTEEEIKEKLSTSNLVLFQDHTVSQDIPKYIRLREKQQELATKYGIQIIDAVDGINETSAVCHTHFRDLEPQLPGSIIIGSDSHTPTAGVNGALAIGKGALDVGSEAMWNETMVVVPETIRVNFTGSLPPNCTMKDAMLTLLATETVQFGRAINRIFEYGGEGIGNIEVDDLSVLTNMSIEAGATSGIVVEPNEKIIDHIAKKSHKKHDEIKKLFDTINPDTDAQYAETITIDLSAITPMIAVRDNPRNAIPIHSLQEPLRIDKAFIGSCTGGNFSDLKNAAEAVLQLWKQKPELRSQITLTIQPSSLEIIQKANEAGYIDILKKFGAKFLLPGCGACVGMGPGGVDGPNQTVFSTTNRNFPGRMGKGENSHVILGGPISVINACIKGFIS